MTQNHIVINYLIVRSKNLCTDSMDFLIGRSEGILLSRYRTRSSRKNWWCRG